MGHPVYVHVGPPRTGTTAVQQLLWNNREELLSEGICYPHRRRGMHFAAATDLVYGANVPRGETPRDGAFEELTHEILAHDGPVVVSHERLSSSDDAAVARLRDALAGRDLHVVYTIRDLVALTLSGYYGVLKRGSRLTLDEHVAKAVAGRPRERAWKTTAGRSLRLWGAAVPPDRMHVVTVPPKTAPRSELWDRFSSVIGHDPGRGSTQTQRTNESVGVVEAAFLLRLNNLKGADWTAEHQQFVRHVLTPQLLSRREGQRKIQLSDRNARRHLARQTQLLADEIAERGFHVVGDLSDLEVEVDPPHLDPDYDRVSEDEFTEIAMSSTRQLVQLAVADQNSTVGPDQQVEKLRARTERFRLRAAEMKREQGHRRRQLVRRLARRVVRRG